MMGELVHRGGGVIVAHMWWVVGAWCGGQWGSWEKVWCLVGWLRTIGGALVGE